MRQHWLRKSRSAAISRLCALSLIVLATLPFTAPFAAIDFGDLFGSEHPRAATAVVSASAVSTPSHTDDADDVIASDACVQRGYPAGLCALVLIVSPVAAPPSQVVLLGPLAARLPIHDDVRHPVPLRV